ncbi:MBG domain-containing protein [Noviherbaspirillum sp. UKPF54]|uniref:MBG domain-containing protein n=1 Tax=Noviherbaspirillum sp. UKPF54 TaxID=2601898 RepID=UPI0011B1B02A|nr:MBG domain-containing protein [Noviherbaspirillum sp. UKPF54]QDZ29634.1 filamentous hemagglutinin N-terminal domain-containing protein [Noviherbaspirillum sp. UKPF54]
MNRIYRVVWNASKGVWQAASELGTARGKIKSSRMQRRRQLAAVSLSLAGTSALAAGALPTGGSVVAGSGNISTTGSAMTINQSTGKMAIDWQGFSIGQGNSVTFVQPSASAVALNRVLGADASMIQGALKANGQVFLINPNGVLFSPTAQVNVGGLVASTLNMKTEDFLSGKYQFEGSSGNAVINQGNIQAAPGGSVALIAAKITNAGSIDAPSGNVLMGAGSQVMLDFGGPVKLQVQKAALDAMIANGGAIRADGGTVLLNAQAAGDLVSTVINNTGLIQAQTLATGEQGKIMLLGDMHNGRVEAGGTLDASAPSGGNGGFIETSAAQVDTAPGLVVNAGAKNGSGGQWLIDPYDYTITATAASNIANTLNNGTSVTVSTQTSDTSLGGSASTGNGDITVASAITKSAGGDATLTLRADRNIIVNSDVTSTVGKLNITLNAANKSGATTGGVDINANLKSNGGNILIGGAQGATTNGIGYAMNLDSSRAAILVEAGKSILSQGGNITINGKSLVGSSSGSYSATTGGVYILSNATIQSGTGNLFITGESAGGLNTFGIGFEAKTGTVTTIGSAPNGGNMLMNAVNSSPGQATKTATLQEQRDQGAIGLINYGSASGNSPTIVFQGPSVASWLVYINGVPQLSGYTRTPQVTCSSGYLNCGYLVVPGSNNSYLYAAYQAVDLSTMPIYVIQTGNGSKIYDGTTAATGLTLTSLGGPSGFAPTDLNPYPAFSTASKNVATYSDLIANPSNLKDFSSGGTTYAVAYYNNGTYTITPKALTPIAAGKVYDGTTTAAVTATGLVSGDNVTLSGSGTFGSKNVGNYNVSITGITLSGADAGNYSLSGTSASANASITPRTVTLSATKTYDGTDDLSGLVTIGNLVNNETLAYSGATANSAHAASAQYINGITLNDGSNGGLASNYQLPTLTQRTTGSNTAAITPKTLTATLTNSSVSKEYDGTTAAPSGFSPSWTISGYAAGDSGAALGSANAAYDSKDAGVATKVTVSGLTINSIASSTHGSLPSDYVLDASSKDVAAGITPRSITVSATGKSKIYGEADPALSYSVTGGSLVNSEALTGSLTRATGENAGTYDITQGSLTSANNSNYAITFNNGNLTITPRPISVVFDAKSKVYGSADPTLTYTISSGNLVGSDALTLSRASGENAGSYAISTQSNPNYTISATGGSLTITPRPISVTADNKTKNSGSADPQFTWNVTGGNLIGSDALTGELARDPGELAGTYGIHRGTLGNSNYAVAFADGTLSISAGAPTATPAVPPTVPPSVTPAAAPAVAPAQYTSTVPNLTPPAVGGLTYVAVPDVPASPAGSPAGTSTAAAPAASQNAGATSAAAPDSAQADGDATPNVVSRQKQTASQATSAGRDVKFLNVMVVSGGIHMPGDLSAPAANTSDSK